MQIQFLLSEFGVAIVIVHHTRKSPAEIDPFDAISGTLGLSGAADTALVLRRDSSGATLYGRGRDIEEFDTAVPFDKQDFRWKVLGAASEVRRTDERSKILSVLIEADEILTPADIKAETGMNRNNLDQLLLKMAKDGQKPIVFVQLEAHCVFLVTIDRNIIEYLFINSRFKVVSLEFNLYISGRDWQYICRRTV